MKSKYFRSLAVVLALLAVALALPVPQARADEDSTAHFMLRYDVSSATETFCVLAGTGGSPFGAPIRALGPIATSGSSTTATSSASFGPLAVGDIIFVNRALTTGVTDIRRVAAKASDSSLTLDVAIDWTGGFQFSYKKANCGTSSTDGWIDVSGVTAKTLVVQFNQGDITSLEWRVWGLAAAAGATPTPLFPESATNCGPNGTVVSSFCDFLAAKASFTTGTGNYAVQDLTQWKYIRLGVKYVGSDTSDTGTNMESVTAYITVSQIRR